MSGQPYSAQTQSGVASERIPLVTEARATSGENRVPLGWRQRARGVFREAQTASLTLGSVAAAVGEGSVAIGSIHEYACGVGARDHSPSPIGGPRAKHSALRGNRPGTTPPRSAGSASHAMVSRWPWSWRGRRRGNECAGRTGGTQPGSPRGGVGW